MERVFKLTFASVLVYRHWFLPAGKLPYGSAYLENTSFPREVMIAILLGSISVPGFYQYYSRHGAQVKKYSKRKLQILNADFSPQFLMRPAGLSWFKIMRPLSESCVWDAGRAGKKITDDAWKNLEMRPEVNVKVKVTQNGMHHSAIQRGITTLHLGFLHQII